MLQVNSLTKKFNRHIVFENVSFTIQPGEIVGLVGENGAGKSTLLYILATLQRPTSGSILFNEKPYHTHKKFIRKQIGFVPQDIALWENFTVEENMVFFEKLSTVDQTKEQLKQLCLKMRLTEWEERVRFLSGGTKRKLNLALSLIHDPKVLLLDEPTVGIDLKSRIEIGMFLKKLAIREGKIILYTSHDMDEINTLCDRVICLGKDPFYQNILHETNTEVILPT